MTPEPVTASASPFHSRAHRLRTAYRHAIGLILLTVCGCSPMATTEESGGSTHVFAWAWDVDKDVDDFLEHEMNPTSRPIGVHRRQV